MCHPSRILVYSNTTYTSTVLCFTPALSAAPQPFPIQDLLLHHTVCCTLVLSTAPQLFILALSAEPLCCFISVLSHICCFISLALSAASPQPSITSALSAASPQPCLRHPSPIQQLARRSYGQLLARGDNLSWTSQDLLSGGQYFLGNIVRGDRISSDTSTLTYMDSMGLGLVHMCEMSV